MKTAAFGAGCVLLAFLVLVGFAACGPRTGGGGPPCPAPAGPAGAGQGGPVAGYAGDQLDNAARILAAGAALGLDGRDQAIGVMTAMGESSLHVLGYGDAAGPDSRGLFQQRGNGAWGSLADRMDPSASAANFFKAMVKAVPDRGGLAPTEVAHRVQGNADPGHYARFWGPAQAVAAALGGGACAAGPGGAGAGAAVGFALAQRGKPYVWGATGPGSFDCSGLTLRAWGAAGVVLPRTAREQFTAGRRLSVTDVRPGDLLFWANSRSDPGTIHHVALYLGDHRIVEAQQDGVPVHVRSVGFDEAQLLPVAVRPGVPLG